MACPFSMDISSTCTFHEGAAVVCQGEGECGAVIIAKFEIIIIILTFTCYMYMHTNFTGVSTLFADCADGDVRLVGGSNVLEGRVEVCYNNAWGTICSDGFGSQDAEVVCRQTTYPFNGGMMMKYRRTHQHCRCAIITYFGTMLQVRWCSGRPTSLAKAQIPSSWIS